MASKRLLRFTDQVRASWKWLLSFRAKDWCFEDYPVGIRLQESNHDSVFETPRFKQHRYSAYIVKWSLTGGGDTPDEAKEKLRESFVSVKSRDLLEGRALVRPGAARPIEFASQVQVSAYDELSEDFLLKILGVEDAWISDESSLWDFHVDADNEQLYAKIREVYGVDVSDIQSARLWEIFDRIASYRTIPGDK